jgi:hypothetical protein
MTGVMSWASLLMLCAGLTIPVPAYANELNVRLYGADGDGSQNDTHAFVAAIEDMQPGASLHVPAGTYLVDTNKIRLKANTSLIMYAGAILQAVPNNKRHYKIIEVSEDNVSISGGTLIGERYQHIGTDGEWGHAVWIGGGARNVQISGMVVKQAWGDGFYIRNASHVRLTKVVADGNRRQGLSVIAVSGLIVEQSSFINNGGTRPGAGIDLEPDRATDLVEDVDIVRCRLIENVGAGIVVNDSKGPIRRVVIAGNTFDGNNRPLYSTTFGWWRKSLVAMNVLEQPLRLKIK